MTWSSFKKIESKDFMWTAVNIIEALTQNEWQLCIFCVFHSAWNMTNDMCEMLHCYGTFSDTVYLVKWLILIEEILHESFWHKTRIMWIMWYADHLDHSDHLSELSELCEWSFRSLLERNMNQVNYRRISCI